jgi:hypothetical protein
LNLSAQNVLRKSQWIQRTKQDNVTTNWSIDGNSQNNGIPYVQFWNSKKKEVKEADLNDEQNRL